MVRLDEGGFAAREVRIFAPRPLLRRWVQHVSIQPGAARHGGWRVVPDTSGHVIFTLTSDGAARCRLVGARSRFADIDVSRRCFTVAVRLQPGALPALTRDAAAACTDRAFDAADVFGADGRTLTARLSGMTPIAAARHLLAFVEERCARSAPAIDPRMIAHAARVADLHDALARPPRAVHAHLLASVGLAPKRALRIQRLLSALHHAGSGGTLAAAALAAGFSDQAHFTRDARELLGEPPAAWRRRGQPQINTDKHR
jgi:AraC-like DNA-binding protein